jgi:hypothetical protein
MNISFPNAKMGFWNVGELYSKDSNEFNDPIFEKEIEKF